MKLPNPERYRANKVTWPSSATPDYSGEVGVIIHDGAFPYWKSSAGKTGDVPDDLLEDVDNLYNAVLKDTSAPCVEKRFDAGMAIYGHLVGGYFFGRFLLDLEVVRGNRAMKSDLGMARATLSRMMGVCGLQHEQYSGKFWRAPSMSVRNDPQFGACVARWQGQAAIPCDYRSGTFPLVSVNGALLTDHFVAFIPGKPLGMRPEADQLEDLLL